MGYWRGYLLECGANDLHMVQLMPLLLIIYCFSKIQNGLPFWCRLTRVVLEKKAVKHVCVCVCVFLEGLSQCSNYGVNWT